MANNHEKTLKGDFGLDGDIAPSEERSIFMVVGTCIGIPFSFSGYAMNAAIDNYGYIAMFIIGGFFAVATILLSIRLLSKRQIQASDTSPC